MASITLRRGESLLEIADGTRAPLDHEAVGDLVAHVLEAEGAAPAEIGLQFVGERRMRRMNAEHRGADVLTDVLSFPLEEPGEWVAGAASGQPRLLGDIVICPAQALRQAAGDGIPPAFELGVLLVHGALHLLGWRHDESPGPMAVRQAELLQSFDWTRLVRD